MLRECQRVLEPGGMIAGYVIHTPVGLSESRTRRAAELGPTDVAADGPPQQLANAAGFVVVLDTDVTADFRATCEAIIRAHTDFEEALRAEQGDEAYEAERWDKRAMLQGIDEGFLRRSLIVAVSA